MFRRSGLVLYFGLALALLPARAASITLQGTIGTDDAVQLFNITVASPGLIDIRSYGYAGGTTSTGTSAPRGGFDTILTLFDSTGLFLTDNDDGTSAATDPITGQAADARITANLAAGSYTVALTQYDNFSIGDLADGFAETGNPHFTADPAFTTGGSCAGNLFRDISGTTGNCRNGNWTLDFVNVASVTPVASVPEPGTVALFGAGLLGFALVSRRKRRAAVAVPILLVTVLTASVSAQAPDYSNVDDFLNGKRTLLSLDDLVVAGINVTGPQSPVNTLTLTSANSQLSPPTSQNSTPIALQNLKVFSSHILSPTSFTSLELFLGGSTGGPSVYLPTLAKTVATPTLTPSQNFSAAGGLVADFNQDGLDEVVLNYANGTTVVGSNLQVDSSGSATLTYGPLSTLDTLADITVGDFNGDGRLEIAGLVILPSGGLDLVIYTVDPKTFAISKAAQITLTKTLTYELGQSVSITAGRFASAVHDQIVIADGGFYRTDPNGGQWNSRLELIDFPPSSLMPQETTTEDLSSNTYPIIKVKAGRFNVPKSLFQQVVYGSLGTTAVDGIGDGYLLGLLSIDPSTLAWNRFKAYFTTRLDCGYDMVVGNFDNREPDPSNPGQTQLNLNDQIAVLHGACGGSGERGIDILFNGNTPGFNLSVASTTNLPSSFNNLASMSMTPADTQGRSLLLGPPTKITVSLPVQPSVVIGAPPMHVDWVSTDPLDGIAPQVMNLSAVPDGFNTTYEVENTAEQQSGTTNGTSWSYGTKTTVGGYVQFGDPDVAGIKVSDMSTAAQDVKSTAEQGQGSYTRNTYNIYQATGFGDELSYNNSDFNIWVYPVIGQSACPAPATPNCQKVPLTIQFSASNGDAIMQQAQGQSQQWYQPPWEPGNIFSYPANFDQLQNIYPNLAKLTKDGAEFITDTSTETQKTTWAVGTNANQTTSVEENYSYENDFSSEASFSFLDVGGGVNVGYDVSGSNGLTNLTKSSSDLGTSTGIGIRKPGTFPDFNNYAYSVSPYILGTTKPGGLVDDQPLSTDVRTFGSIRGLFTADPLTSNSGGWWQQAYSQAPDVALNHPSRWQVVFQGLANPVPSNCLTTGTGASQMDCAELTQKAPKNPWLSTFHQMRGFFISNANSPGQGPQLEQAKAGDVLTLQTRVYNYSLAAMPAGSKVHVRFYFQPWKGTVPVGDSVLIGEPELDPIPPFSDVTDAPANWVLASTTFDTSKYDQTKNGKVSVAFWVVVWIQGADGNIVAEMPDHGLTGIPGTLESLADAAQLEQIASDKNSYDNNVGFYKSAFYIGTSNNGVGATPPAGRGLVDIGKVDVSARSVTPHDTIAVSATLSTSGAPVSGISAIFYDGDPREGGRIFGVERVPYIDADTSYDVATTYRTNACATHQLFVVLNKGRSGEIVRRAPPVRVTCSTSR